MHHFFVPPEWIGASEVVLLDAVAHQIRTVLRLRPGEQIAVLDNTGWEYTVLLVSAEAGRVAGAVIDRHPARGEPPVSITLYQALLKKDNFEWVLQKGTEIGAAAFVPIATQRTVVPLSSADAKKQIRWERILTEAAEQSRRGRVPALGAPQTLRAALADAGRHDRTLIPWEGETTTALRVALTGDPPPASVAIFIGPEGGFAPEEIALARDAGAIPVSLGPRILRAETAALAAILLALATLGGLESAG